MKKGLVVLVLSVFLAGGVFASPFQLSAGGGLLFDYGFNDLEVSAPLGAGGEYSVDNMGFGVWGFFDITFAELSIAFMGGPSGLGFPVAVDVDGSFVALDFSLLGKFPFSVGRYSAIFPLLGIGYNLVLSATYDGNSFNNPGELSTFRIQFGLGADFGISQTMFIRTSLLGAYRFAPRYLSDLADYLERVPLVSTDTFGFGFTFKIGLGFRL